jgi:hypothetical protein
LLGADVIIIIIIIAGQVTILMLYWPKNLCLFLESTKYKYLQISVIRWLPVEMFNQQLPQGKQEPLRLLIMDTPDTEAI